MKFSDKICRLSVVVVAGVVGIRIYVTHFIYLSRTTEPILTKLGTKYSWAKIFNFYSNEETGPLSKGDDKKI